MLKVSHIVKELLEADDLVQSLGNKELLNLSAYARDILPSIEKELCKPVKMGSVIIALKRYFEKSVSQIKEETKVIQTLSVHSNLEGMTFERTFEVSKLIREIYQGLKLTSKSFFTVTQGLSEVTIVAEKHIVDSFRNSLKNLKKIYDKRNLVGIAVKFDLKYLEIPNIIFLLNKRLALKNVNIIEIISTATEITFIIDKAELHLALETFNKILC